MQAQEGSWHRLAGVAVAAPAPAPDGLAPDPTLESDVRMTAALRVVLDAREVGEMARLVRELKLRPILEEAMLVRETGEYMDWEHQNCFLVKRSKAPWFFGLLDHYDWAMSEGWTPGPRHPLLPYHSLVYFQQRGRPRGMIYEKPHFEYCDGHDVDWVATTFFERGCNAEGLRDRRIFVEEVLGLDGYAAPDLEERVKVLLDAKVHQLFTTDLGEYCITEEEAEKKRNYKIVATVDVVFP